MRLIRYLLGRLILFVDWLTSPKSLLRSEEDQRLVNEKLAAMKLYELTACPFCVKVRRACKRLGLPIERVNVKSDAANLEDLQSQGGKYQVPCLRIEQADGSVEWLYESSEIITYLSEQFLPQQALAAEGKT